MTKDRGRFTPQNAAESSRKPHVDLSQLPWQINGQPKIPLEEVRVNVGGVQKTCYFGVATQTNRTFTHAKEGLNVHEMTRAEKLVKQHAEGYLQGQPFIRAGVMHGVNGQPDIHIARLGEINDPKRLVVYYTQVHKIDPNRPQQTPAEIFLLIAACRQAQAQRVENALPGYRATKH